MSQTKLVVDRLAEILETDAMETITSILNKRSLRVYWGTAPTGRIHLGYFIPLLKIADLLDAGCTVTILLADLHAELDAMDSSPESIEYKTIYYKKMITSILKLFKANTDKLNFVRGTEFQLSAKYNKDFYKLTRLTSIRDSKKAGAEVVKQSKNPKLSGMVYPLLQALDEEYLAVDCQLGGIDQRKIFTFASKMLPLLGYKRRIHLMNPMLTAINAKPTGVTKMSASQESSKIDLLDNNHQINIKLRKCYAVEKDVEFNPVLDLLKLVIFPLLSRLDNKTFTVFREKKEPSKTSSISSNKLTTMLGVFSLSSDDKTTIYSSFESLQKDYIKGKIHPADLKENVGNFLANFLTPLRLEFSTLEARELISKAYP